MFLVEDTHTSYWARFGGRSRTGWYGVSYKPRTILSMIIIMVMIIPGDLNKPGTSLGAA